MSAIDALMCPEVYDIPCYNFEIYDLADNQRAKLLSSRGSSFVLYDILNWASGPAVRGQESDWT